MKIKDYRSPAERINIPKELGVIDAHITDKNDDVWLLGRSAIGYYRNSQWTSYTVKATYST
jgi:hypothetical protein